MGEGGKKPAATGSNRCLRGKKNIATSFFRGGVQTHIFCDVAVRSSSFIFPQISTISEEKEKEEARKFGHNSLFARRYWGGWMGEGEGTGGERDKEFS